MAAICKCIAKNRAKNIFKIYQLQSLDVDESEHADCMSNSSKKIAKPKTSIG